MVDICVWLSLIRLPPITEQLNFGNRSNRLTLTLDCMAKIAKMKESKDAKDLTSIDIYPRSTPEEVLERCATANAVLTNKNTFDAQTLDRLPQLRYIGLLSTGTNVVDLLAAQSRNIAVTHIPGYATDSVAQLAVAMILQHATALATYQRLGSDGRWACQPDFSLPGAPTYECAGKHVALLGQGNIGRAIRRSLEALGMTVHPVQLPGRPAKPGYLTMDQALPQAAIVVLACPLTNDTRHLMNADTLSLLPASCHIVNIARGPLVDEQALLSACHDRPHLFYSSDVLSTEPPPQDHPFFHHAQIALTPHVAWSTIEARQRLRHLAIDNLMAWISDLNNLLDLAVPRSATIVREIYCLF